MLILALKSTVKNRDFRTRLGLTEKYKVKSPISAGEQAFYKLMDRWVCICLLTVNELDML